MWIRSVDSGKNIASSAPDREHDAAAKFQLNLDRLGATAAKADLARINETMFTRPIRSSHGAIVGTRNRIER